MKSNIACLLFIYLSIYRSQPTHVCTSKHNRGLPKQIKSLICISIRIVINWFFSECRLVSYLLFIALIGRLLPRSMNECEMRVWRRCFRLTHMGGCDRPPPLLSIHELLESGPVIHEELPSAYPLLIIASDLVSALLGLNSSRGTKALALIEERRWERAASCQPQRAPQNQTNSAFISTEDNRESERKIIWTPAEGWRQNA